MCHPGLIRIAIVALLIALSIPIILSAEPLTVIIGTPFLKATNSINGSDQVNIGGNEANQYALSIIRHNDSYLWASRENKKLLYSRSGVFHNFIAPGSGYIRVTESDKGCIYMEHLTLGLSSITYWGSSTRCNLP